MRKGIGLVLVAYLASGCSDGVEDVTTTSSTCEADVAIEPAMVPARIAASVHLFPATDADGQRTGADEISVRAQWIVADGEIEVECRARGTTDDASDPACVLAGPDDARTSIQVRYDVATRKVFAATAMQSVEMSSTGSGQTHFAATLSPVRFSHLPVRLVVQKTEDGYTSVTMRCVVNEVLSSLVSYEPLAACELKPAIAGGDTIEVRFDQATGTASFRRLDALKAVEWESTASCTTQTRKTKKRV